MIGSKMLDSSVWIAYFVNGDYKEEIEYEGQILTSVLSLIEIPKRLSSLHIPTSEIIKQLEFIKKRGILKEVTAEISEQASKWVISGKLHTVDSVIYQTALINKAQFITLDNDFRGLANVTIL